jgi:hypothetical protein
MRIRLVIGVVVMTPMDRDPTRRRVLKTAQSKDGERVLEPNRAGKGSMRQQPMKAEADAERSEYIQADECDNDACPTEEPGHEGEQRQNMNGG